MKKINFSMWRQAVTVVPQLNKKEWDELDFVSKWLVSTRAFSIVMTLISVLIVGLLAFRDGVFNIGLWLLVLVGLIFAHATNNLLNDFTDYIRGVDEGNYFRDQYGPQPLEEGFMTRRQLFIYAAINGLIAAIPGIVLIFLRGGLVLPLMIAGVVIVLLYTYPLKYIALGELSILLAWGPLMVGGGYYVLAGAWSWNAALAGLVYSLGVTSVIFGKHLDKREMDKAKGVHTLPVVLGEKAARYLTLGLFVVQYLLLFYLIAVGYFSLLLLVVVLAIPTLIRTVIPMFRKPRPKEPPADYPEGAWPLWFVGAAFIYNRRWGFLFLLGLVLDIIYKLTL